MKYFESHAHLKLNSYDETSWWYDVPIDNIINNAKEAGVDKIVDVRCDYKDIISLKTDKRDDILYSIGLHPNESLDFSEQYQKDFIEVLDSCEIVAIGEVGLDLHYNTPIEPQLISFKWHLEIASKHNLPVILHIRDAYDEFFEFVKSNFELFEKTKVVLHCFAGEKDHAELCKQYGFYLGVGGTVTFKNNTLLQEIVADYPKELIMLETDCPFLAPVPFRGKKNEPANLVYINEYIAKLWNLESERVAAITYGNSEVFFSL